MTDEATPDLEQGEPRQRPERLSQILGNIAAEDRERISIGDLLFALRRRALGALMFIFAAVTALPMPPGVSAITGAPLIFLTIQLMLGMPPWLPRIITERSLSRAEFARVVSAVTPWLARAEGIMRPRYRLIASGAATRIVGALGVVLSIILFLPIPLGNMLPSLAIAVFSLGLLERDGLWVAIGFILGIASIIVVWGVLWAMLFAALFVLGNLLSLTPPL